MTKAGTYTLQIEYFPPGDPRIESVSLDFEYNPEASVAPQTEQGIGTEEGIAPEPTTTFQNLTEGFRIQVPNGWVADDQNMADYRREAIIARNGFDFLGAICPQEDALPKIGGLHDCISSPADSIIIIAYPNLHTRAEFAPVINQGKNITIDDIIAYDIEQRKKMLPNPDEASSMSIEGQTDRTVNVVDPNTNQIVQTVPAREVIYGLPATFGDSVVATHSLIVLADNGNTGYSVRSYPVENIGLDAGMPAFARQAFDSFELLSNSSGIQQQTVGEAQQPQQNNATTTTPSFLDNTTPTAPSTPFTPVL
jgi:hypothetical protein